jgi:DNA-binding transcriptional ArsR family regulator
VSAKTSAILLHPVRLRVVLAVGTEQLTTAELGERLPDVAPATLYRQVAVLAEGGLLEVVDERRVRGGVERTYALVASAVRITPDDLASMTKEEHLRGFIAFAGSLVHSLATYLEADGCDPSRDGLSYRQAAVWVTPQERAALAAEIGAVLAPYLGRSAAAERDRMLLNTILIPDPRAEGRPDAAARDSEGDGA